MPRGRGFFSFNFTVQTNASDLTHLEAMPRAIAQLVTRARLTEVDFTLTSGRCDVAWAAAHHINIPPLGAQVRTRLHGTADRFASQWNFVRQGLSTLMDVPLMYLQDIIRPPLRPALDATFPPLSDPRALHGLGLDSANVSLHYGVLPSERICTENIGAWLSMWACGSSVSALAGAKPSALHGGLSALLHSNAPLRRAIRRATYTSLGVSVFYSCATGDSLDDCVPRLNLRLELDAVIPCAKGHILTQFNPDCVMDSLFATTKGVVSVCPLASHSAVLLELPRPQRILSGWVQAKESEYAALMRGSAGFGLFKYELGAARPLSVAHLQKMLSQPDQVHEQDVAAQVPVADFEASSSAALQVSEASSDQVPAVGSKVGATEFDAVALRATFSLLGSNDLGGELWLKVESGLDNVSLSCLFAVPPELRPLWHTLKTYASFSSGGLRAGVRTKVEETCAGDVLQVLPAASLGEAPLISWQGELAHHSTLHVRMSFEKRLQRVFDLPSDAKRGVYVNGARILVQRMGGRELLLHTNGLIVPMPLPDETMLYNAMSISSTMLAIFAGSFLTVLRAMN